MSEGTVSSSVVGKLADCYSSEFHRTLCAVLPVVGQRLVQCFTTYSEGTE